MLSKLFNFANFPGKKLNSDPGLPRFQLTANPEPNPRGELGLDPDKDLKINGYSDTVGI